MLIARRFSRRIPAANNVNAKYVSPGRAHYAFRWPGRCAYRRGDFIADVFVTPPRYACRNRRQVALIALIGLPIAKDTSRAMHAFSRYNKIFSMRRLHYG